MKGMASAVEFPPAAPPGRYTSRLVGIEAQPTKKGDSMLVINQITGSWKCNKEHLQKARDRCKELITKITPQQFELEWVPREQNEEADALSRKAYEEATGQKFPVRIR